jgi:hypothetical protein
MVSPKTPSLLNKFPNLLNQGYTIEGGILQRYPPGTQNNYVVFLKLFVVTETGKELNFPKGGTGL